jgi:caa(3)-type oxidase subunit IV
MSHSHSIEEVRRHTRTYLAIFGGLGILTIVTVVVGGFHMAIYPALAAALAIAIVKGSLVAGWFMHLKTERPIIVQLLIATLLLLLFMFAIFVAARLDQEGTVLVS